MSEEEEEVQNDGTWSGLKKTIIGILGTVATAGGVWLTTLLGGGGDKEAAPLPAPAPVINITNSNQQQSSSGTNTVIIKEKETVKEPAKPAKKKEGDEFKEEAPKW
jgi:flagellar basal body-associated protein FliL